MDTQWEKQYLDPYSEYIKTIIKLDPDFIVPVARKSCKLFGSLKELFGDVSNRIYYREYFNLQKEDIKDRNIAIVDDAVFSTSTLKRYKKYFIEEKGVPEKNITTFAFIGHNQLSEKPKLKCEKAAKIFTFLPNDLYNEYLMLQSDHIILKCSNQDIDHLVLEAEIDNFDDSSIEELENFLDQYGYRYHLKPIEGIERFAIHHPSFFPTKDILSSLKITAKPDFVNKIRFTQIKGEKKLLFIPIIFPSLSVLEDASCKLSSFFELPFELPCDNKGQHNIDKFCYLSLCFLLSCLLARKFLLTLKETSPQLYKYFGNIKVRKEDLKRYLGHKKGEEIGIQVEKYLNYEKSSFDEIIEGKENIELNNNKSISLSRENVPLILNYLREGYKKAVEANNGNPEGVKKFVKPVEELLVLGTGTHPLIFTEVIDEFCDFGVLVPHTKFIKDTCCYRRLYRTGEDKHDVFAWDRTKRIIPLAIQTLNKTGIGVDRLFLEKVLANFGCDFSHNLDSAFKEHPERHCIKRKPSYWGPQNYIIHHTSKKEIPLSPIDIKGNIYKLWVEFASFFEWNVNTKKFYAKNPLTDITEYWGDYRFLRDYFRFLAKIKNEFGDVYALTALSICRKTDNFYSQIKYNIENWEYSRQKGGYASFLGGLKNGNIHSDSFDFSSQMALSLDQKCGYPKKFKAIWDKCEEIVENDPLSFNDVWERCKSNINKEEAFNIEGFPIIKRGLKISKAIVALNLITRFKLRKMRSITSDSIKFIQYYLNKIDIDIDANKMIREKQHITECYNTFEMIHHKIKEEIELLPPLPTINEDHAQNNEQRIVEHTGDISPETIEMCKKKAIKKHQLVGPGKIIDIIKDEENGQTTIKIQGELGIKVACVIKNNTIIRSRTLTN